ncbi:uncharacterized protein DDB_G0290301 isoform X2 [Pangasianodon hypophthalmus]|nr:uncharacterized protein DDB_G0290301 isoform X2 [Pangasianodon hypophthalmus]XP_053095355.1 uncharacterized protein DDB_G0290301 isoform X2 [Pangasianodon hypophthalmus]XP_053095356.1 uncharacterized protein DDB_G0290301 isoform X2 [Pangasianodon hypophthalmus]XP_053095357.1 uncharacterized protein DDB_G0290301 isoform X2 [Pangasianodon hypophthalmus]
MDEAEKYQQRLQAIAEKRRMQEEEEKVRREMEEERLKLAQDKRKSRREQWLMEATPSSAEDPKLQSVVSTPQTTEQRAEEIQSSERQMKTDVEKSETMNEESSQIGENEPSVHSTDNTEKPAQEYLGEEERNVLGVLEVEVEVEGNLLSKAAQEDTEEKRNAKTEEQEVAQLAMDLPHHLLQHNKTPDEALNSLADRKMELIMAEDDAEVEEEEWEMVNCSPEEGLDMVLTCDLTQAQTDSSLGHKGDGAVLKVEQVFIMDEEEDLEIGASEVLSLVVAEKSSDLQDTSCEFQSERSQEERPPEGALQTPCFGKGALVGTSAPLQELSNVSGIISEESPECKQPLLHLPVHTSQAVKEILGDNTEYKGDQGISASRIVKMEWKETSGPEDEVFQYIPLDRKREKSPPVLQREMVAQSIEQESEIQTLMPPSATPNRAETVTSTKRKTCHCCTVM